MKTLFIPCYWDGMDRNSGSARIRAEWVARHWDGAQVYDGSQRLAGYDLYVFQKLYLNHPALGWITSVARWRNAGRCLLAFDLCDPDWLESPAREYRLQEVLPTFDFAATPTEPLRKWLAQWLPAYKVPDRVDLDEIAVIGPKREGSNRPKPAPVWAGYAGNVGALDILLPTVERLGLSLRILSKAQPVPFLDFWREILQFDILLNPRPDVAPYSYKSDNKTHIAWALGMPVARTADELERLCDPAERLAEVARRRAEIESEWDVRISVQEWKTIVEHWRKTA